MFLQYVNNINSKNSTFALFSLSWNLLLKRLTVVTRVNPFGQQETAELVFSVYSVLDLHQVRCHAEGIILQVALTRLTPAEKKKKHIKDGVQNNLTREWRGLTFRMNRGGQCLAISQRRANERKINFSLSWRPFRKKLSVKC